jgi:hypothetical protein
MGQKVNPKIFRLGLYNTNWDSSYIEKNYEESTLLISNDVKIRDFISRIFLLNGLLVHSCKLRYTEVEISIFIYYYKISKKNPFMAESTDLIKLTNSIYLFWNKLNFFSKELKILIKVRDINTYSDNLVPLKMDYLNKIFRRYLKENLFSDLLSVSLIAMLIKNSSRFLVSFLVLKLKIIKNQNKILVYLKLILSELIKKDIFKVNGVKFIINGRFNKSPRSRKKDIVLGSIPLQSISAEIDYFQSPVFTLVGTFGVKLWICRKINR